MLFLQAAAAGKVDTAADCVMHMHTDSADMLDTVNLTAGNLQAITLGSINLRQCWLNMQ